MKKQISSLKFYILFLSFILIFSLFLGFTGCKDEQSSSENENNSGTEENVVIPESFVFKAFSDDISMGDILLNNECVDKGEGYSQTVNKNTSISLTAQQKENFDFLGWYSEKKGEDSATLISSDNTFSFVVDKDITVYARFDYKVTALYLDGREGGFSYENDLPLSETVIYINSLVYPDPDKVVVYGVKGNKKEVLDASLYDIDKNGYDCGKTKGTYTIKYTYKKDNTITQSFKVIVKNYEYDFKAFVNGNGGKIFFDNAPMENGYTEKVESGTKIVLQAVADTGYEFSGWYNTNTDVNKKDLISDKSQCAFTVKNAITVYAEFSPVITKLKLENQYGEEITHKLTIVTGKENSLDFCNIIVKGVNWENTEILFENETDYIINKGVFDINVVGNYTISFVYKKDNNIKANLIVEVINKQFDFSCLSDSKSMGYITISGLDINKEGYNIKVKENSSLSLQAVAETGYKFTGWYDSKKDEQGGNFISKEKNLKVTIKENMLIYARFDYVETLFLDGREGNIQYDDYGNITITNVLKNSLDVPRLDKVRVYKIKGTEKVLLGADDYTLDKGGYDGGLTVGVFEITYTLNSDKSVKTSLIINVYENKFTLIIINNDKDSGGIFINGERVDKFYTERNIYAYEKELPYDKEITFSAKSSDKVKFVRWEKQDSSGQLENTYFTNELTVKITDNSVYVAYFEKI